MWIFEKTIKCGRCGWRGKITYCEQCDGQHITCPNCQKNPLEHFNAAQKQSWWDGPKRFGHINRNPISWIQKYRDYEWVMSLYPQSAGCRGLEIAGPSIKERGCLSIGPSNIFDIKDDARVFNTIKNNSIDYILSTHVFEHIDQNPILTLKRWFEILKPNGMILIIMPDKNFFQHDPNVTSEYNAAPNEMTPDDMRHILKDLKQESNEFQLLSIDTHKNNFDFEVILKKDKYL